MPKYQLLRQVKAKSLTVKIPKNEPNTARLSWLLANEMNDSEAKSAMLRSYRRILVTERVRRQRLELAI